MVWRYTLKNQSKNCLVIVIVYAKGISREIGNKAVVVVVYNKLWKAAQRIAWIIKNFN